MTDPRRRPAALGSGEDIAIADLLARMTVEEKAALTVGGDLWTTRPVERLGIPSIWLADGPTGVRKAPESTVIGLGDSLPATCFPTASALAATWDVDLAAEVGRAIGAEAQAQGVQILLGPGVNLKRSPLCGRNFEYFSEDPVLSGELAAAFIAGVQSQGVGTSLKHLAANESETGRMYGDSVVDERALRELTLRPFEIAIAKGKPWTVMAAYNRLNGVFCCEHRWLLHDILEEEWGYRGIVVSDWFAVDDRVAGIDAGLHLQMPAGPTADGIVAAVEEGRLDPARLDEVVGALLRVIFRADAARRPGTTVDLAAHHRLARRAGADAVVLLRNDGPLLPLGSETGGTIALLGAMAKTPRFQGSGSSRVVATRVENLHDELAALLGNPDGVAYAAGYEAEGETVDPALLAEARAVAAGAAAAVVVVGLPAAHEAEGSDRPHLGLPPAHDALVESVLAVQPRTVVVILAGTSVAMPWAGRAPAIVHGWLGGQGGGGAIADILLGRVNPSGKLPETFPVRLEDSPAFLTFPHDGTGRTPFAEGLFAGYRWYDARGITPLFPFGHGLSYTSFAYDDLVVEPATFGPKDGVSVSLHVRNTGDRAGQEVVQLYLHERQRRLPRPPRELKAFAKVALGPGESRAVRFRLAERDFAVYDPRLGDWTTNDGVFDLLIGASSRDIRLQGSVTLAGSPDRSPPLSRHSPVKEWLAHPRGRSEIAPALAALGRNVGAEGGGGAASPLDAFVQELPIAKLVLMGALSEAELAELVERANATG